MKNNAEAPYLYVFVDEGGNLDFSSSGTQYFTLTMVTQTRPFDLDRALLALKYDLIESGLDIEYFHAAEDRQQVRNRVFSRIASDLDSFKVDCLIVEKSKTMPELQAEDRFYPEMLGGLLRHTLQQIDLNHYREVIVITDTIPVQKRRRAIEKTVKQTLRRMLQAAQMRYQIIHHASKSCISLQVADYCNWAIFRKWERGDRRSYETIQSVIRSESPVFQPTAPTYY